MSNFLETAVSAARAAGALLRENFGGELNVNAFAAHDIKLELDERAQELITQIILARFPDHAIYGEEGMGGNPDGEFQWIVDPLDGTVNYFYGIPHFCVSVAVRRREENEILAGVIYDPMREEIFTTSHGAARVAQRPAHHGQRTRETRRRHRVGGLAKVTQTIDVGLPLLTDMIHRVRKCRMMGSAALDLAYVACGRLDAYIETGISLWDVAAGILLVNNAGGRIEMTPRPDQPEKYAIVASSGRIAEIAESGKRIAQ